MILGLRRKTNKFLEEFERKRQVKNFKSRVERGVQTVKIDKIVGSVGRCFDFDANFSLKSKHSMERLESIKEALKKQKPLPVVELYKMDDEYYVVDGHHRIAGAKELGQRFIDAHVIEYLPPANTKDGLLARKRLEFEYKTGLHDIKLSRRSSYDKLLAQIQEHKKYLEKKEKIEVSFKEAARDWFQSIYYPIVERIEKENLRQYLPEATAGDIYVYLCNQISSPCNLKRNEYKVELEEALEEFGILVKATELIFSGEGLEKLKKNLLKLFLPSVFIYGTATLFCSPG